MTVHDHTELVGKTDEPLAKICKNHASCGDIAQPRRALCGRCRREASTSSPYRGADARVPRTRRAR